MSRADTYTEILVLGGFGALLIFINAGLDMWTGTESGSPIQFIAWSITLGLAGVVVAILIALFVALYWKAPSAEEQRDFVTLVALFSAFSLWIGGGFLVGFILAFTAGILGLILTNISGSGRVTRTTVISEVTARPPPPRSGS